MTKERLQKIIASSGLMSRRKAEEAIVDERVKLNGIVVTELGTQADPNKDEILVDDEPLGSAEVITVMFNKPRHVITSKSDPEGRKIVMDFFPNSLQHLNPVGRLDFESEGLLLLSSDGELLNQITHPRYEIPKIYLVWIKNKATQEQLDLLRSGIELEDGQGKFADVEFIKKGERGFVYQIYVNEGRNRFIRRMWEALEHPVLRLKRIQIGNLSLTELKPGQHRVLKPKQIQALLVKKPLK